MSKLAELDVRVAELRDEIAELEAIEDITPEQDARLDAALAEFATAKADFDRLTERAEKIAAVKAVETGRTPGVGQFQYKRDTPTEVDVRTASRGEARSAALKLLEQSLVADDERRTMVDKAIAYKSQNYDGDYVARSVILTEDPAYQSAFAKGIQGREALFTEAEREAVARFHEFRVVKGSVDTSGGYGIPVVIDPTIRITSGTGLTGLLPYITVEPVTTDSWRGVTAAHTTWAEVTEGGDGTDDAPTFGGPSIPVVTSRATIPYSIEAEQDYPGLASQLSRVLESGYMDHLAARLAVGTGTTTIKGVFTALDATTGSEVAVTTDALFGAVDIDKVFASLGERFRQRAVWYMNVDVENEIRAFGSGTATSRFTVDQTAFGISLLNGRPLVTSDWAPLFTGTTGAANILCFFDPTEYILAQRIGMSVEYVPHLQSAALPNMTRAWMAYARAGGDIPVTQAGRILQNT